MGYSTQLQYKTVQDQNHHAAGYSSVAVVCTIRKLSISWCEKNDLTYTAYKLHKLISESSTVKVLSFSLPFVAADGNKLCLS